MSLKEAAAADSANRRLLKWFEHRGLSQGVYWGVGTPDTQFCTEIARATRASLRLGEGLSGLSEISLDLVRLRAARPASVPGSTVTSAAYEEVVRLEQRLAEMDKQREVLLVRARGLGDGAREAEQSLQVLDSNIASTRDRLQSLRSAH